MPKLKRKRKIYNPLNKQIFFDARFGICEKSFLVYGDMPDSG